MICYFFLYVISVPIPIRNASALIVPIVEYTCISVLVLIIVAIAFLCEIVVMHINLSVKGKTHIKPIKTLLMLVKTIFIIACLSLFTFNLKEIFDFSHNISNANVNKIKYHNLYEVLGMKIYT
jgi:hypothetical protein